MASQNVDHLSTMTSGSIKTTEDWIHTKNKPSTEVKILDMKLNNDLKEVTETQIPCKPIVSLAFFASRVLLDQKKCVFQCQIVDGTVQDFFCMKSLEGGKESALKYKYGNTDFLLYGSPCSECFTLKLKLSSGNEKEFCKTTTNTFVHPPPENKEAATPKNWCLSENSNLAEQLINSWKMFLSMLEDEKTGKYAREVAKNEARKKKIEEDNKPRWKI